MRKLHTSAFDTLCLRRVKEDGNKKKKKEAEKRVDEKIDPTLWLDGSILSLLDFFARKTVDR